MKMPNVGDLVKINRDHIYLNDRNGDRMGTVLAVSIPSQSMAVKTKSHNWWIVALRDLEPMASSPLEQAVLDYVDRERRGQT